MLGQNPNWRIDPHEAAPEKQWGQTSQNFRVLLWILKWNNPIPKFSRLQQSFSYTLKIQKWKSSLPHHSSWLAATNGNYQEGGVGCCDCSIGFDKGWFQFPHLLQGGRPDPVILGNCVLAWWRKKNTFKLQKSAMHKDFIIRNPGGEKKNQKIVGFRTSMRREKRKICLWHQDGLK